MRRAILFLLLAMMGATLPSAPLRAQSLLHVLARHVPMDVFETVRYTLQCPAGYVPSGYSITPQYPYDQNEDEGQALIDRTGAAINRGALSGAAQLDGGGYAAAVFNIEHHAKSLEAIALCVATAAASDNTLQLVKATGSVARQTTDTVLAFCPAGAPAALGGFSNADGVLLVNAGTAPVWGSAANPILLSSLADGAVMGPPAGWQVRVRNVQGTSAEVSAFAYCGNAPDVRAYVYANNVPAASFGVPTAFSVFAPVPDGSTAIGVGYDGGQYGQYLATDAWLDDGTVPGVQQWIADSKAYDSGAALVRAFIVRGNGTGPSGTSGRAVAAVLAVAQAGTPPTPTSVTIVEYYHAGLDHYFITANADEIAKLDNGTLRGWARTGATFKAYAPGSTGRTGRRPVCREYGLPQFGLDSHFYSASPDECATSMVITYGAWELEASEVFQMDLPDPATGACPAGGVPVYRIWNKRQDSNHRYTTSLAIRDQMIAKGGVAEGYGPGLVALCGLP